MATEDGSAAPIYDNPKSPKEVRVAKKGDTKMMNGEEYESYGSAGTREGGKPQKKEDDEGDLDEEGWDHARKENSADYKKWWDSGRKGPSPDRDLKTTDDPEPKDPKGWRRQYWRRKDKPEVPTS